MIADLHGRLLCDVINEDRTALMRWENEGGAIPVPHSIERRIIRDLHHQYGDLDIRAGLRLAITLCDAVANDMVSNHTVRHRLTKHGRHLRAAAHQCRDAIQTVLDRL